MSRRELHPTALAVLRALRAGAHLSRNRHFHLFEDPRVRRALRANRLLASVAADVRENPAGVVVEHVGVPGEPGHRVRIELPAIRGRRTVYLTPGELELLVEDAPELSAALGPR